MAPSISQMQTTELNKGVITHFLIGLKFLQVYHKKHDSDHLHLYVHWWYKSWMHCT